MTLSDYEIAADRDGDMELSCPHGPGCSWKPFGTTPIEPNATLGEIYRIAEQHESEARAL